MKKLLFAAVLCAAVAAFADEAAPTPEAAPATGCAVEKACVKECDKAGKTACGPKSAGRDAKMAKKLGLSEEEFRQLTPEERKAKLAAIRAQRQQKRDEADRKAAEKAGLSLEEFRAQRKARMAELRALKGRKNAPAEPAQDAPAEAK